MNKSVQVSGDRRIPCSMWHIVDLILFRLSKEKTKGICLQYNNLMLQLRWIRGHIEMKNVFKLLWEIADIFHISLCAFQNDTILNRRKQEETHSLYFSF